MIAIDTRKHARWEAVLAGRAGADDADTETAALLRAALQEPAEPDEALDSATLNRVMDALEARGTFRSESPHGDRRSDAAPESPLPITPAAPRTPRTPRRPAALRAFAWPRWTGHVALAIVLVAVPVALLKPPPGPPDLPPGAKQVAPAQTVHVDQPAAEATRLVGLLGARGASVQLEVVGAQRIVRARLPADRLGEFEALLATQGLTLPPDGQLAVTFAPLGK